MCTWTEGRGRQKCEGDRASPRFVVVHNRERKEENARYPPGRPWYREQRKNSTESSAHGWPYVDAPGCSNPRSPRTQDVSCISHAILRQASSTSVHDLAHAPSLHMYRFPSRANKKNTSRLQWADFLFYYLGSEGDSRPGLAEANANRFTVARRSGRVSARDRKRKKSSAAVPSDRRVRARVYLYPRSCRRERFRVFPRQEIIHERKEKDLRAANNVAQLRS